MQTRRPRRPAPGALFQHLKRHQRMTSAAGALGLERSHLYKKCQQLGIDLRALRKPE